MPPVLQRKARQGWRPPVWLQVTGGIAAIVIAASTALGLAGSFFGVKLQSIHMPRRQAEIEHAEIVGSVAIVEKKAARLETKILDIREDLSEQRLDTRALIRTLSPRLADKLERERPIE